MQLVFVIQNKDEKNKTKTKQKQFLLGNEKQT